MSKPSPLEVAVLVDGDNVSPKALEGVLPAIAATGRVRLCRIYGNLPKKKRPVWVAAVQRAGLPPARFIHEVGKNAADHAMMLDAVELACRVPLGGMCLLSSDGDFTRVTRKLQSLGIEVHVFGPQSAAKSLWRAAAGRFHAIDALPGLPLQ